jgi:hypothetical protein
VTIDKIRWLLAKAYPLIGNVPIAQITPHEALAVLRKVDPSLVVDGFETLSPPSAKTESNQDTVMALFKCGSGHARALVPARPTSSLG